MANSGTTKIINYKVDGDVLTKLNDPIPLTPSANDVKFSNQNDEYQGLATGSSPQITIYKSSAITPDISVDGNGMIDAFIKTGL